MYETDKCWMIYYRESLFVKFIRLTLAKRF